MAAARLPNFSGTVINNRYHMIQALGAGSYGVVYKACDLSVRTGIKGTYCAIKVVQKAGRTLQELEIIRREVVLHHAVSDHPNVVTMYDAFEDDAYCFIVLDYCSGGDLYGRIRDFNYRNNDERLRKAFVALIDAVEACHKACVFHRDLKPENILTDEEGNHLFLADFGLATSLATTVEHGCGTSTYMSPECIGRMSHYRPFSTRCNDVWALGVILINMISGLHPWEVASPEDLCFSYFLTQPDVLKEQFPISEGANDILQRIFALNPLHRITLRELRREVLKLDTFFLPEDQYSDFHIYYAAIAATASPRPTSRTQNEKTARASSAQVDREQDIGELALSDAVAAYPREKAGAVMNEDDEVCARFPMEYGTDGSASSGAWSADSYTSSDSAASYVSSVFDSVSLEKNMIAEAWGRVRQRSSGCQSW